MDKGYKGTSKYYSNLIRLFIEIFLEYLTKFIMFIIWTTSREYLTKMLSIYNIKKTSDTKR